MKITLKEFKQMIREAIKEQLAVDPYEMPRPENDIVEQQQKILKKLLSNISENQKLITQLTRVASDSDIEKKYKKLTKYFWTLEEYVVSLWNSLHSTKSSDN